MTLFSKPPLKVKSLERDPRDHQGCHTSRTPSVNWHVVHIATRRGQQIVSDDDDDDDDDDDEESAEINSKISFKEQYGIEGLHILEINSHQRMAESGTERGKDVHCEDKTYVPPNGLEIFINPDPSRERVDKCPICLKTFPFPGHLRRHMLLHSSECLKCNKEDEHLNGVNTNQQIEELGSPGCRCTHSSTLDEDTIDRSVAFSAQERQQRSLSMLTRRSAKYRNPDKHTCSICHTEFNCPYSLKKHLIAHRGDRRLACQFCNKRFAERAVLNRHLVVHTGQKKYTCDTCKKVFSFRSSFKRHILMHSMPS
ncbi:zinc finger protein 716 [Anabrus simplex]|uniref:zinc finger protein 716 n=1 Tax=Anabrus simplex TaxID=316456 RepID=UPI0035A37573